MACSIDITIQLGEQLSGITLIAQLQTANADVYPPISTGFTDLGDGNYLWHYDEFNCDFQGAVCFAETGDPSTVLALTSINPTDLHSDAANPIVGVTTGHSTQTIQVDKEDPRYGGSISIVAGSEPQDGIGIQLGDVPKVVAPKISIKTGVTKV
jgi:hypothetical protein